VTRDYATISTGIWGHPDVRALPPMQQWLYLQLWTHPDLNYAGVLDWNPRKNIAPLSDGSTEASIEAIVPLLVERRFIVIDRSTGEVFLRPYFRFDKLLLQRTLPVSMAKAYAGTGSNKIRAAIVSELKKLRREFPDWYAWKVPQVAELMKHPSIEGPVEGGPEGRVEGAVEGRVDPKPHPGVEGQPIDTDTSTTASTAEVRKRETRLPKTWKPTPEHETRAAEARVNLVVEADNFRLHAETHDRHAANWNAAFTSWLKKARPLPVTGRVRPADEWKLR
jgi:hypothetical protein